MERMLSLPIIVSVLVLIAVIILGLLFFLSPKPQNAASSGLRFFWNEESQTLVSSDPDISIRVFGSSYGQDWSEYVLTKGQRKIGFSTELPAYKTDDDRRIWVLAGLCIRVWRGYKPEKVYAEYTKFEDFAEQNQVLEIIISALQKFAGVGVGLTDRDSMVRISDRLQDELSFGKLIKSQHQEDAG